MQCKLNVEEGPDLHGKLKEETVSWQSKNRNI